MWGYTTWSHISTQQRRLNTVAVVVQKNGFYNSKPYSVWFSEFTSWLTTHVHIHKLHSVDLDPAIHYYALCKFLIPSNSFMHITLEHAVSYQAGILDCQEYN